MLVAAQNGRAGKGSISSPSPAITASVWPRPGSFPGASSSGRGVPTLKEVLTSRLTDRPIRPLFPEHYRQEVQVMANVMACDKDNDPDVLSIVGASAALSLAATIPFQGPLAAVRLV